MLLESELTKVLQFQVKENIVSSVSSDHMEIENISLEERFTQRDIGVTARNMISKNILAKLSSAHIRQFVSPFYKQRDLSLTTNVTPRKHKMMPENANLKGKRHLSSNSNAGGSINSKKNKTINEIVDRLCLPTQNCLLKALREVIKCY